MVMTETPNDADPYAEFPDHEEVVIDAVRGGDFLVVPHPATGKLVVIRVKNKVWAVKNFEGKQVSAHVVESEPLGDTGEELELTYVGGDQVVRLLG